MHEIKNDFSFFHFFFTKTIPLISIGPSVHHAYCCLNERRCLLPLALPSQTVKNMAFMLHFLFDFSAVVPRLQAKNPTPMMQSKEKQKKLPKQLNVTLEVSPGPVSSLYLVKV